MDTKAINEACEIVGGQSALASSLGLSISAVHQWVTGNRPVPAIHCPPIERLTGGVITCERLCPDFDWAYIRGTKKRAA